MKQTIEDKKEYLKTYRQLKQETYSKAELLEHLKTKEMGEAIRYSDLPHSGNKKDLSDHIQKLEEVEEELVEANEEAIDKMAEIIRAINQMDDAMSKEILRSRYILGKSWEQIACDIHMTYRHTIRLHGYALQKFKMPECP